MSQARMIGLEIRRLLAGRRNRLFLALFIFTPVLCVCGMIGSAVDFSMGMATALVLMPAQHTAFISVFATLLFVLLDLQSAWRPGMSGILDSVAGPVGRLARQSAAMLLFCLGGFLAAMLLVIPLTIAKLGAVFRLAPFAAAWGALYFGAIITALLLACGVFAISRHFNGSFLLVGGLAAVSYALGMSPASNSFLLFWVQSNVRSFSDATSSMLAVELILYLRLFWLCAALAVFLLGLCAVRRYGLGLLGALAVSARQAAPAAGVLGLAACAVLLAVGQPFFDNGPMLRYRQSVDPETGIVIYDYDSNAYTLDDGIGPHAVVSAATAEITVDTGSCTAMGQATYKVSNTRDAVQSTAFCMAPGLDLREVTLNGGAIRFQKNKLDNFQESVYYLEIPPVVKGELCITYGGRPRNSRGNGPQERMYGITKEFVFLPQMYPVPMNDRSVFTECTLHLPKGLVPLMAGTKLEMAPAEKDGYDTYAFHTNWQEWLFAGDYIVEELDAGGMDVRFAYLRGREQAIRESGAAETLVDTINFFTETIGPLGDGENTMTVAELDGSFVSGGWGLGDMSVFGEAMFMGAAYKGSETAGNTEGGTGIGVAVHEIAHQWWGWSPGGVWLQEEVNTPWSSEGLTVYSTYLYMKSLYGDAYARENHVDVWRENTLRMQNAFYLNHLEYAKNLPAADAEAIYSAFAGNTRYDLMPMLLLRAEELCGGEDAFLEKLQAIFKKYQGSTLSYSQFLQELGLDKEAVQLDEP